jgi:plasmid maintenance system antidote protein VapI/Zn-dependent peptidase ImmA (M78 family)
MANAAPFEPDWAVPPGATIAAILTARSLSREAFAKSLGETVDTVHRLLLGLKEVDADLAGRLSRCLGSSQSFWINREAQYRADIERVRRHEAEQVQEIWVKQFPVREMASLGWIAPTKNGSAAAEECLKFFGVPDVAAWQARYAGSTASAAFRMSASAKESPGAVAAWLRWAELVAGRTPCAHWNADAFRDRLSEIRRLTWQKRPGAFLPRLRRLCAEAGVAVVVARTPKGCPASGATRFLSPTKALMVLSFRYRSDDQFWFTFFHEAGHLLLHGPDALFLEDGSEVTLTEETEANAFAEAVLVPRAYAQALLEVHASKEGILRFASRVGVAPGLIVGQLQHKKILRPDQFNFLKRRYDWDDIDADRIIP